jgi:heme/copper-type cytochrome/quinol oxidase subunit 3
MSEHVEPRVAPQRRALPNGWWGTAVFVATEATLFGTLIGSYFYLRFNHADWPPGGIAAPAATVPLVLTAVLVATSVPMQVAASAARQGALGRARAALALALLLQSGYFAMQISLFRDDLARFQPTDNAYGSIYYTLLGAHHAHVFAGILLVAWLLLRLARGLTSYRAVGVHAVTLYWHVVNVLAIVVVGTQLSPSV